MGSSLEVKSPVKTALLKGDNSDYNRLNSLNSLAAVPLLEGLTSLEENFISAKPLPEVTGENAVMVNI